VLGDPSGFPGDGGPGEASPEGALGTTVSLNHPTDLAFDIDGTLLVMAWHNHKPAQARPRDLAGLHRVRAGAGFRGDGGAASQALFRQPRRWWSVPKGERYIVDQQNYRIRMIDPAASLRRWPVPVRRGTAARRAMAGLPQRPTSTWRAARIRNPPAGSCSTATVLFFADTLAHRIRVIDPRHADHRHLRGHGRGGLLRG
jgi:hypothetical protein